MALPKSELVGQVKSYLLFSEDSPPPDVHFGCSMHQEHGIDVRADLFIEQEFYVDGNQIYEDKFVVHRSNNQHGAPCVLVCKPLCLNCARRYKQLRSGGPRTLTYDEGRQRLWKAFRARMVSKVHDE